MADLARSQYVRTMAATYVALFLIRLAFGVVAVTLPLYLPTNNSVLALVAAASPLLELVTIIFAGFFIDRFGRKGVLLVGLGLGAIALYAFSLTQNPFLLGGIQAIQGIAAAFILVTTLAVLATYAPPQHRGREMGIFNFANIFGIAAGYAVGSALTDPLQGRYQYSFVIAGVLATIGLLFANRMIHLPNDGKGAHDYGDLHPRPSRKALIEAFTSPRILLLVLPWLIVFMLVGALLTYSSRLFSAIGVSGGGTSLGILGFGVLLIVAQVFWGRLADKHGREGVMLVGAVGFALLMGVVVYAFFDTQSSDLAVIFDSVMSHRIELVLLLFVALAFAPAGLAAIADEAKAGTQGATMSAYSLTISLGFILGPLVVGPLSDLDHNLGLSGRGMVLFFLALAIGLLALVLTRFVQQAAWKEVRF